MKNIIIWGTGKSAKDFVRKLDVNNSTVIAFVDNNEKKWGQKVDNEIPIISPFEIKNNSYHLIVICSVYDMQIIMQCKKMSLINVISSRDEKIYIEYKDLFQKEKYCDIYMEKLNLLEQKNKYNIELLWRNIFVDTVKGYKWYNIDSISLGRWAVGYSYAYVLARSLESFKPKSILELGLGQSSKIINSYVKYYNTTLQLYP